MLMKENEALLVYQFYAYIFALLSARINTYLFKALRMRDNLGASCLGMYLLAETFLKRLCE